MWPWQSKSLGDSQHDAHFCSHACLMACTVALPQDTHMRLIATFVPKEVGPLPPQFLCANSFILHSTHLSEGPRQVNENYLYLLTRGSWQKWNVFLFNRNFLKLSEIDLTRRMIYREEWYCLQFTHLYFGKSFPVLHLRKGSAGKWMPPIWKLWLAFLLWKRARWVCERSTVNWKRAQPSFKSSGKFKFCSLWFAWPINSTRLMRIPARWKVKKEKKKRKRETVLVWELHWRWMHGMYASFNSWMGVRIYTKLSFPDRLELQYPWLRFKTDPVFSATMLKFSATI